MKKLDLKRESRHLYRSSAKVVVRVAVPAMHFLMVDGEGDPDTSQAKAEALGAVHETAATVLMKKNPPALP